MRFSTRILVVGGLLAVFSLLTYLFELVGVIGLGLILGGLIIRIAAND